MTIRELGDARIYIGDVREALHALPDESVQCVVTSPPYWGLRDYGVDGQIGLERTPEEYIETIVGVFQEIRRVLRSDGTAWVNLGDTYAGGAGGRSDGGRRVSDHKWFSTKHSGRRLPRHNGGLKPKDLVGIPWQVAFALRADGWYLRQDIIWKKNNPMPESVCDRCTKAHEYLFLLSKSPRYYYDADAIREEVEGTAHARGNGVNAKTQKWKTPDGWDTSSGQGGHGSYYRKGREKGRTGYRPRQNESFSGAVAGLVERRNRRSVWEIGTAPYREAHFATYPPELVKPCILAGSRPGDTILDPFAGSGTTGGVALEYGRKAILIELSEEYANLIPDRIRSITDALEQPKLIAEDSYG